MSRAEYVALAAALKETRASRETTLAIASVLKRDNPQRITV